MRDYVPVAQLRSGPHVYIRRDQVGGAGAEDADVPSTVVVAGTFLGSDEFHIVEDVPLAGLSEWEEGLKPIQDALPMLSQADRHFVQSGMKAARYPDVQP